MITLDNIRDYTFGAVRIWEDKGYFRFSRFTEKQDEILENRKFSVQRISTAGIRIEFMTFGGELSFSYTGTKRGCKDDYFSFDISVDGTPVYHYIEEDSPESGSVSYSILKSEKEKKVTIYLSNLVSVMIKDLNLPMDSRPVKKSVKLLAYGDSITQGDYGKHPNHTYINILADNLDADLINLGVEGEKFFAGNIDEELNFDPDIVTVAYGVNDYSAGILFGNDINDFLDKINHLYGDKKIFVLLPIWYKNGTDVVNGKTLQDGRDHIKETASKYGNMTVIDCSDFVPHLPDFYGDDLLLHPSDLGHMYYAKRLTEAIRKYL